MTTKLTKSGCPDCGKTPHKKDCIFTESNPTKEIKEDTEREKRMISLNKEYRKKFGMKIGKLKSYPAYSEEILLFIFKREEKLRLQIDLVEKRAKKEIIQEIKDKLTKLLKVNK